MWVMRKFMEFMIAIIVCAHINERDATMLLCRPIAV